MRFARATKRSATVAVLAMSLMGVAACGSTKGPKTFQTQEEGGFKLFGMGGKSKAQQGGGAATIGVNGYLWRASLDTLGFMPLASADPYGGVIITDWYVNPEKPDERFKVTVYILDTRLRADGLNVTTFKQVSNGAGAWTDAPVNAQTETDLENAILTRARQLRLSNIDK